MNVVEMLDKVQQDAQKDEELRLRLLASRQNKEPLKAFCTVCQQYGYPVYPMEVIDAGEEFHAAMKRSTNGGGENSPKLDGEDDFYELFLASLKQVGYDDRKF